MTGPDLDRLIAGWRGPALAALIALVAGLPGLLLLPPLDRDESRFAEGAAQMLESGDYINIRFQDEARWNKPVGAYWLQAAAVSAVSSVEARDISAYRLPSLLGAMLAATACAWAGMALFGARPGVLAGAALGATFLLSTEAGIAQADAVLCGAVTLALAALSRIYLRVRAGERPDRRHKLLFWLGLGLAILVKGVTGLLVVGLTIAVLSAWDRDLRWLRRLGWGWGLPLLALIIGPWTLAITIATDGEVWRSAASDLTGVAAGAGRTERGFPGMALLLSPLLMFPAVLLAPAALVAGWTRRNEPAIRFLLCWLIPAWLLFELAPVRTWHGVLPTFGALALLIAAALGRPIDRRAKWAGVVLAAVGAFAVSGFVIYGLTEFGSPAAQALAALSVAGAIGAVAIGAFLLLNRAGKAALAAAIGFGLISHGALAAAMSQMRPLTLSPQVRDALATADLLPSQGQATGPIAITGYHEPSFVFLTGRDTELTDAVGAARALSEGRPAVVEAADADAFAVATAQLGASGRIAGVVSGYNYSTGEPVSLTLYAPRPVAPSAVPESRR